MYTQYTAVREIKDRTVFMYIQYTVKYEIRSGTMEFYVRSKITWFGANYMNFTILFGGDDILIFS